MKKLSWPKILLIVVIAIVIVLAIIFLISCKSGKCIFGGAAVYKANAAGCAITGGIFNTQLPIRASTGQCLKTCGAATQCDGAYPGYTWQTGETTCNWCTDKCKYGSSSAKSNYYPFYASGNNCYYNCKLVDCVIGGWKFNNCLVDRNKGCSKDVCGASGWASGMPGSNICTQPACNSTTHTSGNLCSIKCGASPECSSAYPKQFWVVGDGCNWCTDKCIYKSSLKAKKNCPGAICSAGGWSYPKTLNCY